MAVHASGIRAHVQSGGVGGRAAVAVAGGHDGARLGLARPTTHGSVLRRATSRGRRPAATSSSSTTTRGWRRSTPRPATSASSTPTSPSPATTRSSAASTASRSTTSPTRPTRRCARRSSAPAGRVTRPVYGNLLFMSVEETRGRIDCGIAGRPRPGQPRALPRRADLRHQQPRQPGAAARRADLPRLAHPHARHRPRRPGRTSTSTTPARPASGPPLELAGLRERQRQHPGPGDDRQPDAVAHRRHQGAAGGSRDGRRREPAADLHRPGDRRVQRPAEHRCPARCTRRAPRTRRLPNTNTCHDITAYPALGLAAGACQGNGILLDISDPVNPVRLDAVSDPNFSYWHSATLNNDGTKVIFTDEWGGGTSARCRATDQPEWGADALFDIVDGQMEFAQLLQDAGGADRQRELRRPQLVAGPGARARHPGAGVVPGRPVGDRLHRHREPRRDRVLRPGPDQRRSRSRPDNPNRINLGGLWSTYWYNGTVYGTEIARGLRHVRPDDERPDVGERDRRGLARCTSDEFNAQHQTADHAGRRASTSPAPTSTRRYGPARSDGKTHDKVAKSLREGGEARRQG